MPLTKASLVQALFEQEILSKAEAARAVDAVFLSYEGHPGNGRRRINQRVWQMDGKGQTGAAGQESSNRE